MNTQVYDEILKTYKSKQTKKLLIAAAVMVVGFALAATGVGGLVGIVAMIYLMMEGVRTFGIANMRNQARKKLKRAGRYEAAVESMQQAEKQELDGLTYAWNHDFFCTGGGVILPMQEVAWLYLHNHTVNLFIIPVVRQHWCQMRMIDGRTLVAFYGKVKDQASFEKLLQGMRSVNPELQIGYTPANVELYKQRVALHKSK